MFPRIFGLTNDGTPVGALPLYKFLSPFEKMKNTGVGSVLQHMHMRSRNVTHMTSQTPNYQSQGCEVKLNMALNFKPTKILLHRGPEGLPMDGAERGISLNTDSDTYMEFGETEMHRNAREIMAAQKKRGPWTIFGTITANPNGTPGFQEFVELLHHIHGNDEEYKMAYQSALPIIVRLVYRAYRAQYQWITTSHEKPLGEVLSSFFRLEFQDGAGAGNLPHGHMGITTAPEPIDRTMDRFACRLSDMKMKQHGQIGDIDFVLGTTCEDAIKNGMVANETEYYSVAEKWEKFHVSYTFQRSSCFNVLDFKQLFVLFIYLESPM